MSEANINESDEISAKPVPVSRGNPRRIRVSIVFIVFGAAIGLVSLALVSNQFGNTDSIGLFLFGGAGCIFVTGVAYLFVRFPYAVLAGIVAAPLLVGLLFVLFWMALFASAFQNRDHQDFATNGVSKVQPALQMENLYDDCRH